ncbi:MAG: PIN domain-containing protein [Methylococcaceae bacterium]
MSKETVEKTIRVLLIDLENCPNQAQQLMENLEKYSHVIVCYAQSGAKIPLDWVIPLTTTVNDDRLKIIKMPNSGKNAADFGITFWAGMLMAQLPLQTHFDIVSNDTDLDHVVSLLKSQDRSAQRIGTKKENPAIVTVAKETETEIPEYLQKYCEHLKNHSKPAKKETLLNSIKSTFKTDNINPEELFEELSKQGVIAIKDNRITYNPQKITEIAGQ